MNAPPGLPLQGLTVAITASRRAQELSHIIEAFGATSVTAPMVTIESDGTALARSAREFEEELEHGRVSYAVFMTGPAASALLNAATELGVREDMVAGLNGIEGVIARSEKPRRILEAYGIAGVILPQEATVSGVISLLSMLPLKDKTVATFWHGSVTGEIGERLKERGANFRDFAPYAYSSRPEQGGAAILSSLGYRSELPSEERSLRMIGALLDGRVDIITFTSPPAVENLFEFAKGRSLVSALKHSLNGRALVVAVGPSTKKTLESHGIEVDVVPEVHKMGAMVKAVCDYVESHGAVKRGSDIVEGMAMEKRTSGGVA